MDKDALIIKLAVDQLPRLEGVAPHEMTARVITSRSLGVHPHEYRMHIVAFSGHPLFGEIEALAYVIARDGKVTAEWGYGGTESHGLLWPTPGKAYRCRQLLREAGFGPSISAMYPPAAKVLRDAGL